MVSKLQLAARHIIYNRKKKTNFGYYESKIISNPIHNVLVPPNKKGITDFWIPAYKSMEFFQQRKIHTLPHVFLALICPQ